MFWEGHPRDVKEPTTESAAICSLPSSTDEVALNSTVGIKALKDLRHLHFDILSPRIGPLPGRGQLGKEFKAVRVLSSGIIEYLPPLLLVN